MTSEQLDASLAAAPVAVRQGQPRVSPPLEALIDGALDFARALPEADAAADRELRAVDARRIRARLPAFLLSCDPRGLRARVSDKRLVRAVSDWRWGSGGMMFVGRSGIGKSSAAAWLFRRLLGEGLLQGGEPWDRAHGLHWYSADDLARSRLEHSLGRGEAPEVVRAECAGLLFLDDLGWDRDPAVVSTVLARRYEAARPTIVTSGRSTDELSTVYGAAVIRRMAEAGGRGAMTVVDCFAEGA
jgi:hypothetical protein